ncbi:globin [Duganella sp. FT135W]|uniref:Globin n=1 Tax=Duganella flavida TaxID=2692175 RepID=A0A6L8K8V2_9BURK|nr:group III truncated hemoglobin [Duganella flavida]MYM22628.1 globin [Duganella flavida]
MSYHELNTTSITKLVHEFYDDVRADPELFTVFSEAIGSHWEPHLDRMVDFWSTVMLGTKSFQGNVYGKHMLLRGVTPKHFATWLALFEATSTRLFEPGIARELQITAGRIGESLKYGFFGSQNFIEQQSIETRRA